MAEGAETKRSYVAAMVEPLLDRHPGETCCVLLEDNRIAFLARLAMVDRASISIDVQYYIIRDDLTGLLLVQRLVNAADRGVKVRVLIDDAHTAGQDALISAFDKHPNIVVRLFNPFPTRRYNIVRLMRALLGGRHLLKRMHNKALIVDDAVAIVGGRNLGDEYFDAGDDIAFHDLDVAAFGPVVPEFSRSFQVFWDSPASRTARAIAGHSETKLTTIRKRLAAHAQAALTSEYGAVLRSSDLLDQLSGPEMEPYWGRAEVVFDDPTKLDQPEPRRWRRWRRRHRLRPARMMPRLIEAFESARDHVTLISPYFVPGERGCEFLEALIARGVAIRVLTNSLAATDVPIVHAGYERYRRRMLRAGVTIHEMRRDPLEPRGRWGASSGASLHAKAFSVDGRLAMVGSMNMDPRSAFLNTELGVLVDSPALAERIELYYRKRTDQRRSYAVSLKRSRGLHRLTWEWIDAEGTPHTAHREPDASVWRRALAQIISWLPLEAHL